QNFFHANSLPRIGSTESHFAVVQQHNSNQSNAKWPKAGHHAARLILGRKAQFQPARPSCRYGENRERDVAQLGEDFLLEVPEAVGMSEKQSAGNGDQNGKRQPSATGFDAASLHAPLKNRQSNYQHGKKTMQQDFRIRKSRPEADGAERPSLGITSKK